MHGVDTHECMMFFLGRSGVQSSWVQRGHLSILARVRGPQWTCVPIGFPSIATPAKKLIPPTQRISQNIQKHSANNAPILYIYTT